MTHKIVSVKPMKNFVLLVGFQNGIEKTYDMRTLYPIFPQFEVFENDINLFNQVQVDIGGYGISWNDDLDLDAEDIWEDGIEVGKKEVDIIALLAENLVKALKGIQKTIVITSHDLYLTTEVADNILFIKNGKISWQTSEQITVEDLKIAYKDFA